MAIALFLLGIALSATVGSELEPSSGATILDILRELIEEIKDIKESTLENEQTLSHALEKTAVESEALKREFRNLSLHVKLNQRDQTLRMEKLSQQVEEVQNSCFGEPPSPQNGRPVDFERKHGSDVCYRCDEHFWMTGNSTVRCSFGKWEGHPPVCRFFDTSFSLRVHYDKSISNVTCSSEVSKQKVEFSRDIGLNEALPSYAKIFSRGKASVLDLSSVHFRDKRGVYNCGYEKDESRTGISFRIDENGWFVRRVVASLGGTTELSSGQIDDLPFRWFHEGQRVPSGDGRGNLTITDVKVTDAGTYRLNTQGFKDIFFKLVVRGCRSTLFGEGCDQECPPCYNGGTCHDLLGVCVCPPGFTGTNCELACGENKYGENCSESCSGEDCMKQIFCKPYPSGCFCAPGYEGYFCTFKCSEGKFGADCIQTCRCAEGSCDPYTGACPGGCSPGWTGQSCQIPA